MGDYDFEDDYQFMQEDPRKDVPANGRRFSQSAGRSRPINVEE
jgi:hypothetical protein